jgi:hypothetical protein
MSIKGCNRGSVTAPLCYVNNIHYLYPHDNTIHSSLSNHLVVHPLRAHPRLHQHHDTTRLATHRTWLLEVPLLLGYTHLLTVIHSGMCHITHSSMLEQTDIQLITELLNQPEDRILTKRTLIQLQRIKSRVTGIKDKECFCASVRRKVWLKDFNIWYEGATG